MTEHTLLSDRSALSAKDSIKSIIKYAQTNDNRRWARLQRATHASTFLGFLIISVPTFLSFHYFALGGWQRIHPTNAFVSFEFPTRPLKIQYTPEAYVREIAEIKLAARLEREGNNLKLWS